MTLARAETIKMLHLLGLDHEHGRQSGVPTIDGKSGRIGNASFIRTQQVWTRSSRQRLVGDGRGIESRTRTKNLGCQKIDLVKG